MQTFTPLTLRHCCAVAAFEVLWQAIEKHRVLSENSLEINPMQIYASVLNFPSEITLKGKFFFVFFHFVVFSAIRCLLCGKKRHFRSFGCLPVWAYCRKKHLFIL